MTLPKCCHVRHSFDTFHVQEEWWPSNLNCLIVGESPGGLSSHYFYDLEHPVRIRRNLLIGLHHCGLITEPTVTAFKTAGFLFDHAIRCQIPATEIKREWQEAKRYNSQRAAAAHHLAPLLATFPHVWAMGYIARNAVACLDPKFPKEVRKVVPAYVPEGASKYFVARYLLNIGDQEITQILEAFKQYYCRAKAANGGSNMSR